jgi:hypothetical protein
VPVEEASANPISEGAGCPYARLARLQEAQGGGEHSAQSGWKQDEARALAQLGSRSGLHGDHRLGPIYSLESFKAAQKLFARPIEETRTPFEHPAVREIASRIGAWTEKTGDAMRRLPELRISQRVRATGTAVGDGLNIASDMDTAAIQAWLDNAAPEAKEAFLRCRSAVTERLHALSRVAEEAFGEQAQFAVPFNYENVEKFAQLFGGQKHFGVETGVLGLFTGLAPVAFKNRKYISLIASRKRRAGARQSRADMRRVDRINEKAGENLIDYSKRLQLFTVYKALKSKGVKGDAADRLVLKALELGKTTSHKPWGGVVVLRELILNAQLDPTSADFAEHLEAALTSGIYNSHRRGAEFVIRDPEVARHILTKLDGRLVTAEGGRGSEDDGDATVRVDQAGGSVLPGTIGNNRSLIRLGAYYVESLQTLMKAVVTQSGDQHRAQRKLINPFFSQDAVVEHVGFIEETVQEVLGRVSEQAVENDGKFDFKNDLALNFPIAITCKVLGLPSTDAKKVQKWTEDAMRSLDIGAGLSEQQAKQGNESRRELMNYLEDRLARARLGQPDENGLPIRGAIGELAAMKDLPVSDESLISDLGILIFAGYETTTSMLSKGIYEILKRRDQWDFLQSQLVDGPELEVPDRELRWYAWITDDRKGTVPPEHQERFDALDRLIRESEP